MQKIWVQGTSFELQEIYGLEQNRSSARASGLDDIEGKDCVICMNAERNTTVLPCRHMCMCYDCAQVGGLGVLYCAFCVSAALLCVQALPAKLLQCDSRFVHMVQPVVNEAAVPRWSTIIGWVLP